MKVFNIPFCFCYASELDVGRQETQSVVHTHRHQMKSELITHPFSKISDHFFCNFCSVKHGKRLYDVCFLNFVIFENKYYRTLQLSSKNSDGGLHNRTALYPEGLAFESRFRDQLLSSKASIHPSIRRRISWDTVCVYHSGVIPHPV